MNAPNFTPLDASMMQRAIALAMRGEGSVEPNPMVGCVIARGDQVLAEGWHQKYGGPHAEVEAIRAAKASAVDLTGSTFYVTLEPCCHQGKTGPCTQAVIAAKPARVVIAQRDPFPQVAGQGIAELEAAGIVVEVGLLEDKALELNAPYLHLLKTGRPWVIAKWAMSLDGRIATSTGDSRWISGEASRQIVQALRGRVDAVMVGSGTALADDPLLNSRPDNPQFIKRKAVRIVFDSRAQLPLSSQLVRTAQELPVIVAVSEIAADRDACRKLVEAGCEVLLLSGANYAERLTELLAELGKRRMTNLLVEGGGKLLGALFDQDYVDEVHTFIAPKIIGGSGALGPVGGVGAGTMGESWQLVSPTIQQLDDDLYLAGRVKK